MPYFDQLHPWCIIRPLPNLKSIIVARFRRRNDAEAHRQILLRMIPDVPYSIIFDATPENTFPKCPAGGAPISPKLGVK